MSASTTELSPYPPELNARLLLEQLRRDVFGKEVQIGPTYSYTWLADQVGHICIGMTLCFIVTAGIWRVAFAGAASGPSCDLSSSWEVTQALGFCTVSLAAGGWEFWAYSDAARSATGAFPLDRRLLARNAAIAAGYMVIGAAIGWAFHQPASRAIWPVVTLLLAAIVLAPWWLKQKITWQKAGLPYLFRLADAQSQVMQRGSADELQALVDAGSPPQTPPRQIVLAGPISSGRTSLACGLATDYAFRGRTVRYLTLASLIEFANASDPATEPPVFRDGSGPVNIGYWPWTTAQMVVIDDIAPVIDNGSGALDWVRFQTMLDGSLRRLCGILSRCHTVWIVGDVGAASDQGLDGLAAEIRAFCNGQAAPVVIQLAPRSGRPKP